MKNFSIIVLIIFILSIFWSIFIEPNILKTKKITIEDSKLAGLKVVFASDFHIKPFEGYRLKKIVKRINEQNPDIILLGGDFVNGHDGSFTMSMEDIAYGLKDLKSKYGTVSIIGNHDGWQGKNRMIKALEDNGIKVLLNSNITFDNFTIAGVDDLQTGNPDVEKALKNHKGGVILLTHTPDVFPITPDNVNLVLAGHLHGGQVDIPARGTLFIPSIYGRKYLYGLIKENGKTLFTSRGLGNSILPVRFNCTPEIVVIDFV